MPPISSNSLNQQSSASPTFSEHDHEEDDDEEHPFRSSESSRALLGRGKMKPRDDLKLSNWVVVKGILLETCATLLFTTVGMVFAGELLEQISEWRAFRRIDELLILVPILINLKGNIEMNLSARLSTAANIGALDTAQARKQLVYGNLWLLQVQALIVSAVAAAVSFVLGIVWPSKGNTTASMITRSGFMEFMMVLASAMSAASVSAVVLGSFMATLVLVCRYFSLDPDNITSPLAACLGDLLTLSLLSIIASVLLPQVLSILPILVFLFLAFFTLVSIWRTRRNKDVRKLLGDGWSALFGAMAISAVAGVVLELFVKRYQGFGMLAIVIGGLPGSVGSVFASRLSTALHAAREENLLEPPDERPKLVGMTLLAVSLPIALLYLLFVWLAGWMSLPILFVFFFVIGFIVTTALSLLTSYVLTHFFWSRNLDPDTYCLPLQSSIVDLIGPAILIVCFELAQACGAMVVAKRQHHHH